MDRNRFPNFILPSQWYKLEDRRLCKVCKQITVSMRSVKLLISFILRDVRDWYGAGCNVQSYYCDAKEVALKRARCWVGGSAFSETFVALVGWALSWISRLIVFQSSATLCNEAWRCFHISEKINVYEIGKQATTWDYIPRLNEAWVWIVPERLFPTRLHNDANDIPGDDVQDEAQGIWIETLVSTTRTVWIHRENLRSTRLLHFRRCSVWWSENRSM